MDSGIGKAKDLLNGLRKLPIDAESRVEVIVSATTYSGDVLSQSTFARELQFLASHTVHHYALISIASRMQGIMPAEGFGIAPSTLKYLQTVEG